jgi:Fe-Mn family superoxide dismutase
MRYHVMPIPFKPPRLVGLSEQLLASHYENNYGGALRRLIAIEDRLSEVPFDTMPVFELNGLGRERLIAANSVLLHEVYFECLGGVDGIGGPTADPTGPIADAIVRDFGSLANWKTEFTAMGRALGGGSGWVTLVWSPRFGRLSNQWSADHTHALADGVPIMALDMYEHAYHVDFGANAGAYMDAFMDNLHWDRPAARFLKAIEKPLDASAGDENSVAAEDLADMMASTNPPLLLDICLDEDLAKRTDKIAGGQLRAPQDIDTWIEDLPSDTPIIGYCVYGYQVSGNAVAEMQKRGLNARKLSGGIAAWHAMGGKTEPLKK